MEEGKSYWQVLKTIKYLGINLTRKVEELDEENY